MQQAWNVSQAIVKKGGNKEDMIKEACKQNGTDFNQVKDTLNKLGINL